jgi:hypothetical protein
MQNDSRRITLVARHPGHASRDWDLSNPMGSRIIFVDAFAFLPHAVQRGIDACYDLERIIIDGTGTPMEFLELLAVLPYQFAGDVLFISGDGSGFVSSPGRGEGRVLYSFEPCDLEFYLQTHALLSASLPGELHVGQQASA